MDAAQLIVPTGASFKPVFGTGRIEDWQARAGTLEIIRFRTRSRRRQRPVIGRSPVNSGGPLDGQRTGQCPNATRHPERSPPPPRRATASRGHHVWVPVDELVCAVRATNGSGSIIPRVTQPQRLPSGYGPPVADPVRAFRP